jgi:hypothetical protein
VFHLQSQNRNLPTIRRLLARALFNAAAALSLLLASQSLPAQNVNTLEYRTKVNYLANFPSFVAWPQEALPFESAPFLIYVFGDFPFGTSLAKITRGRSVHDRRVEIRWIRKPQQLPRCRD